jgi:hypothetical protein
MKKCFGIIAGLLGVLNGVCASSTNIAVRIIDESGDPVSQVPTTIVVNGKGGHNKYAGLSDTNGFYSVRDKVPARVSVGARKDGYYRSLDDFYFIPNDEEVEIGQWGEIRTVILRKIIAPVRGISVNRDANGGGKDFPVYDREIGFDLIVGDWVAPYGLGQITDFVFTLCRDKTNKITYYKAVFPNKGDGIQKFMFSGPAIQSRFKWPYLAPLDGYKGSLKKKYIWGGDMNRLSDFEEFENPEEYRKGKLNYIFRIRTQYDEKGNVVSSYYGRINGDIINMRVHRREMLNYWINTDPASRSLESLDLAEAEKRPRRQ